MSLLPYPLRPRTVLQRTALRRGVRGENILWGAIAAMLGGRGAYVRSQAIRQGVIGGNRSWRVVAGVLLVRQVLKSAGKQPENLGKVKFGTNSFVNVINAKPMTKKQQKSAGITKADLKAQASSDVAAAWARKAADKPKRKIVRRAEKTAAMAAADRRVAAKKAAKRAS
jgi:hypothetical protein